RAASHWDASPNSDRYGTHWSQASELSNEEVSVRPAMAPEAGATTPAWAAEPPPKRASWQSTRVRGKVPTRTMPLPHPKHAQAGVLTQTRCRVMNTSSQPSITHFHIITSAKSTPVVVNRHVSPVSVLGFNWPLHCTHCGQSVRCKQTGSRGN